jgi:lipopolysaccharide export LptBFGC system permease protein LptF
MTTFDLRNPDFFNTDLPKSRENRFNGHNFAKIGIITNQGTNALLQTMTINSNVNRYIFREMLPPLGLNLLFFTFIFLISDMLEITNWIVNYSIGISTVLWMIIYSMPDFLIFVVPMSVMLAILLTFLRMSGDNEIIALTSGGLSFYGLLPPVLLICLMGSLLTGFMTIYALPWGRSSMEELTQKIAASNPDIGLKEKTFNDDFGDMIFYVNKVDQKNNLLIGVFIEDRRQPDMDVTVIATKGRLFDDPEKRVHHLRLLDGTIHRTNLQDGSVSSIHFCFALGLIAVPLGVQSKSANRTFGLIVGLFLFLFYNLLLSAGKILGESGALPPVFGMWLPNVVTGAVAWYLMIQTAKERTTRLDVLARKFQRLPAWFKGL